MTATTTAGSDRFQPNRRRSITLVPPINARNPPRERVSAKAYPRNARIGRRTAQRDRRLRNENNCVVMAIAVTSTSEKSLGSWKIPHPWSRGMEIRSPS